MKTRSITSRITALASAITRRTLLVTIAAVEATRPRRDRSARLAKPPSVQGGG